MNNNSQTNADNATAATTVNPPDVLAFIDQLYHEQCAWNDTHYKTATDKLLDLLSKCADARGRLSEDVEQRKLFTERFKAIPNIASNKPLSLTSRIVRYVFRITGNRASAYARVIEIAVDEKVAPVDLSDWVRQNGGIEEVRRSYTSGQSPAAKQHQKQASAQHALSNVAVLCTISNLPQQLHSSSDNDHPYCLALVRHNAATGTGEVLWGSANNALIKQFLLNQSKRLNEAEAKAVTADAHAVALASDAASINAALNEVSGSNAQVAA